MKKIIFGILITFFILGCSSTKYVYVYPDLPKIDAQPIGNDYDISKIIINKDDYYCLTPSDSKKLIENWLKYKKWAEINYEILQKYNELKQQKESKK